MADAEAEPTHSNAGAGPATAADAEPESSAVPAAEATHLSVHVEHSLAGLDAGGPNIESPSHPAQTALHELAEEEHQELAAEWSLPASPDVVPGAKAEFLVPSARPASAAPPVAAAEPSQPTPASAAAKAIQEKLESIELHPPSSSLNLKAQPDLAAELAVQANVRLSHAQGEGAEAGPTSRHGSPKRSISPAPLSASAAAAGLATASLALPQTLPVAVAVGGAASPRGPGGKPWTPPQLVQGRSLLPSQAPPPPMLPPLFQKDPVSMLLGRFQENKVIMGSLGKKAETHTARLQELELRVDELYSPPGSPPRAPRDFETTRSLTGSPASRPSTARSMGGGLGPATFLNHPSSLQTAAPVTRFEEMDAIQARLPQGSYLTYPEYSFAASRPLKGPQPGSGTAGGAAPKDESPSPSGVPFERYTSAEVKNDTLNNLQGRYIRPSHTGRAPSARSPRPLLNTHKPAQVPMRSLPNGVPVSRLEHHSARRESRSPPRYDSPPKQQQASAYEAAQPTSLEEFLAEIGSIDGLVPQPSQARMASMRSTAAPGGHLASATAAAAGGSPAGASAPLSPATALSASPSMGQRSPRQGLGGGSALKPKAYAPGNSPALAPGGGYSPHSSGPGAAGAAAKRSQSIHAAADGGRLEALATQQVATVGGNGEPLLDESFYAALQDHFRSATNEKTTQLRTRLNAGLPAILDALNCKHPDDRKKSFAGM